MSEQSQEVTQEEINNFRDFMAEYSKGIGATASVIAEIMSEEFAKKLISVSKKAQWNQLRSEMTSYLPNITGAQGDLLTIRNVARDLSKILKKAGLGLAIAGLADSIYQDWIEEGIFPKETVKDISGIAGGAAIGIAIGMTTLPGWVGIGLAGLLGYFMDNICDFLTDGFEWGFSKLFEVMYGASDGINIPREGIQTALNNDIRRGDPIVLDLNGDGISLIKEDGKHFYDLGNDGVAENIDWVAPTDGFLVHDENNNNKVDSIDELFGNSQIDGYDELILFDTNGDGKINADDERFNELKVWIDANGNNVSDEGELKTLAELGIKELELVGKGDISHQHDNLIQNIGNVIFEDGRSHEMGDVFFSTNSEHNIYTGDDVEISEEVSGYPNLKGFGDIPDLHIAAMKNPALKNVLEEIAALSKEDISLLPDLVRKMIFTWGNIERADHSSAISDRDLLNVLFRFSGLDATTDSINFSNTRDTLHQIYSNIENSIMRATLVQTIFSSLENYMGEYVKDYNLIFGGITGDFSGLMEELSSFDLGDNPRLAFNIHEILKEFITSGEVEKTLFDEKMKDFFEKNGLGNLAQDILDGKVIITENLSSPVEGTSYILIDKDNTYQYISTSSGNDYIMGGDGSSHISSGNGNDVIIGGKGDDFLNGGEGNDTYIYNSGDGHDTIYNNSYRYASKNAEDVLKFGEGIETGDVRVIRYMDDLILDFSNGKDSVRVQDYFKNAGDSGYYVTIKFADGTTWDYEYIRENWSDGSDITNYGKYVSGTDKNDTLYGDDLYGNAINDTIYGGAGDDYIYAGNGDDVLIGGTGNDYLSGDGGDDTYVYNLGDGLDTIDDAQGNDTIYFGAGILFKDLKFILDGNNLFIQVKNNSTQGLIIKNFNRGPQFKIENIKFANGENFRLSETGLEMYVNPDSSYGTYGYGTEFSDIIHGTNKNDYLYGKEGDDTLIGGYGDDYLEGGYGSDTYIYNMGDGFDTIRDYEPIYLGEEGSIDRIVFGEGISFENLTFRNESGDLIININDDEAQGIRIKDQFNRNDYKIEEIHFTDGKVIDLTKEGLTLVQSDESEHISGTDFDDVIYGNGGDDSIYGNNGNDILIGGTGNDYLNGGFGADTYIYNLGDGMDTIHEHEYDNGSDYNERIINTIQFGEGITRDNINIRQDGYGYDLLITINGDETQGIRISSFFSGPQYEIEQIRFADGSTIDLTKNLTLNQTDIDDRVSGTVGDDIIYGNGGDDYIFGWNGNNILIGGTGNDTLEGGWNDDTFIYNLGDGFDTISDSYGNNDKIVFGEGISFEDLTFVKDDYHLTIYINGDETQGMVIQNFSYESSKIEFLEFADGRKYDLIGGFFLGDRNISDRVYDNVIIGDENDNILSPDNTNNSYIDAGDGDDTIYGHNGDDVIIGGKGNDIINGGWGNDTYVYNLGDGFDEITDTSGRDKIIFGEGITFQDLVFRSDNGNLYILINGDETQGIKINGFLSYAGYDIEYLEFADGSTHMLNLEGFTLHQKENTRETHGSEFDDKIYCGSSDDHIIARGGNDYIDAGAGDDIIEAGHKGNDIIIGGKGNDTIIDYGGNDTYVYNLGDSFDTINDTAGRDKIIFGEGISFDDLSFRDENGNLFMTIKGDESQGMKISSGASSLNQAIEELHFADGSVYEFKNGTYNANQLIQAMSTFGVTNATTMSLSINELNTTENILAASYNNKVA